MILIGYGRKSLDDKDIAVATFLDIEEASKNTSRKSFSKSLKRVLTIVKSPVINESFDKEVTGSRGTSIFKQLQKRTEWP